VVSIEDAPASAQDRLRRLSDRSLRTLVAEGRRPALQEIVRRHQDALHITCRRAGYEAEEASHKVATAFITLWLDAGRCPADVPLRLGLAAMALGTSGSAIVALALLDNVTCRQIARVLGLPTAEVIARLNEGLKTSST
jgi:DNA-directed RNA polymerase specialized sigma24 family protein